MKDFEIKDALISWYSEYPYPDCLIEKNATAVSFEDIEINKSSRTRVKGICRVEWEDNEGDIMGIDAEYNIVLNNNSSVEVIELKEIIQ